MNPLTRILARLRRDTRGEGLIEYVVIGGAILVACYGGVMVFGEAMTTFSGAVLNSVERQHQPIPTFGSSGSGAPNAPTATTAGSSVPSGGSTTTPSGNGGGNGNSGGNGNGGANGTGGGQGNGGGNGKGK